jgi:amphi-Trp domain-containing protein
VVTLRGMELIEHATTEKLTREAAAERLRELADQLSRHNEIAFTREGMKYRVDVPKQVELTIEIETGDEESELEIEIKW